MPDGLRGLIQLDGKLPDEDRSRSLLEFASHPGTRGDLWSAGPAMFCAPSGVLGARDRIFSPRLLVGAGDRIALAYEACLWNHDELSDRLMRDGASIDAPHDDRSTTDGALILAAYRRWGADCVEHLRGDFAFALWDTDARRSIVAVDQLGARSMYYAQRGEHLAFATRVAPLVRFLGGGKLDHRMVAAHLSGTPTPHSWTFFEKIRLLPPAHVLITGEAGVQQKRYWRLEPSKSIRYRRDEEYAEHFAEIFRSAIRERMVAIEPHKSAILLSGGIDSSAVACVSSDIAIASGQAKSEAITWDFTGKAALKTADEMSFARSVAERWDLILHKVPAHEHWPLSSGDRTSPLDSPFWGHYQAINRAGLRIARQNGRSVVYTGIPGDTQVGGAVYTYLDDFLRGQWYRMARDLHRHATDWGHPLWPVVKRRLISPAKKELLQRLGRQPAAYYGFRPPPWVPARMVREAQLEDVATEIRSDYPTRFDSFAQRDRYWTLSDPLVPRVLQWLNRLATEEGVDLVHPWLDVRLYEFPLAIPQDQLTRAGTYKRVVREGLRDVLPETVRQRRQKTVPRPLYEWALRELEVDRVRDFLSRSVAADLGVLDAGSALDAYERYLRGERKGPHPLWFALTLEIWLRQHSANFIS